MSSTDCAVCSQNVRPRQEAIQCDNLNCQRWTHRTCGTGIDRQQYREAVHTRREIPYTCRICAEVLQATGPLESTRNSLASSIMQEEINNQQQGQFDVQFSLEETSNSTFNLTRPERHMVSEIREVSIQEETVTHDDVLTLEAETTYEVVTDGSNRGKRKLVSSDGYSFVHKRVQKSEVIVWRCSVRGHNTGCPATINQLGDNFQKNSRTHTHEAKSGVDKTVKIKAEIKTTAKEDLFTSANAIVKNISARHNNPSLPEASRSKPDTLVRICNGAKERPADPSDLSFEINHEYFEDRLGETFFRADVKNGERRHLIFATDKQLDLLKKAKIWYIDGTFKVIKDPFYQLLSIHSLVRSAEQMKQLPLVFIIMSGKSKNDYKKVLKEVVEMLPSTEVRNFVVDFEAALWQALRSVFEEPTINGFSFHFGQALWRKVQDVGLKPAYNSRDEVYKCLKKFFALPFLPAEDIPQAFESLKAKVDENATKVCQFVNYVDTTWIQHPVWKVDEWSVFGRSVITNNDVEGWHHRLNRRAAKGNLPFYVMITLLYTEAKDIPTEVKMVSEGKLHRYQRKQTHNIQGQLMELWENYNKNTISTSRLLKECSRIYSPQ